MHQESIPFNKGLIISFMKLLKPYWKSSEKKQGILWLFIAMICTIAGVQGSVWLNSVNKDFFDALQAFNMSATLTATAFFSLALFLWTGSEAIAFFFKERLGLHWGRWLTNDNLKEWFAAHKHYHLLLKKSIDNPDQRISQDLSAFPILTIGLFFTLLSCTLSFISFGYILWNLSSGFPLTLGSKNLNIPGYLFWSAIVYGVLGTWVTQKVGKRLASLDYEQERLEANFRFSLVRARESSEQIALLNQGEYETYRQMNLFKYVFTNSLKIMRLKTGLNFCTGVFISSGSFVGGLIGLPLYFSKQIQMGSLMQISGAFTMVLSAFAIAVQSFQMFAQWKATVYRLAQFKAELDNPNLSNRQHLEQQKSENQLVLQNLNVFLPNGSLFLKDINLGLNEKRSYLIKGKSGSGKSLLLKTLAGIWPYATGNIFLPPNQSILFIPQNNYLPISSLKNILASDNQIKYGTEELKNFLIKCRLEKYLPNFEEEKNWQHILSTGEQQLLSLARVFIKKPDIIVLDESTSALDESTEAFFYRSIKEWLPHSTLISVGHRESIEHFHDEIIYLSEVVKKNEEQRIEFA